MPFKACDDLTDAIHPAAEAALSAFPDGYFQGEFGDRRWGITVRRSNDARRMWLYAEELGGSRIVSFNLYRDSAGRPLLKPCEMSAAKVIEFVVGLRR